MSEVFDPEKVERYDLDRGPHNDDGVMPLCELGDWVRFSEFQKLLALYRELVPIPPDPSTLPTIEEMRGLLDRT